MTLIRAHGFGILLTVCFSLLLTSCSSVGPSKHMGPPGEKGLIPTARQASDYEQSAEHYLALAEKSDPSKSAEFKLLAADMYARAEEQAKAESLLAQIQKASLSPEQKLRWNYTEAQLALLRGQPQAALNQLPPESTAMQTSKDMQRQYLTLKALAHARLNQDAQSVQARLMLDKLLVDPEQSKLNHQAIWQGLNNLPHQTLVELNNRSHSNTDKGWYQLAQINQQYDTRPDILAEQFAVWRQSYPTHPGNDVLPQNIGFAQVSDLPTAPSNIALLLPMSGKLSGPANAIRDGFLASYYQTGNRDGAQPQIKIYDTSNADIQQVYRQAMQEGADFMVGPLSKHNVLALSQLSNAQMRIPVLALNHNDQIHLPPEKFYQFSLSPENEAAIVADKAYADGYRRAGVVVPNNQWGRRIADAFKAHWRAKGGQIARVVEVDPNRDQSASIRTLLNIDQSNQRASEINSIIGTKAKFEPRRREDIDFIMLAAPPEQARQLRPLFNFYYAGNLPVYATSSVYSGTPNPTKDRDMNGIIFCDMPWILDKQHAAQATRSQLESSIPTSTGQYQRLYAMGADAYVLTSQLARLTHFQNMGVPAATGTLYLGPKHQIERNLKWAKMENGVPRPL